MHYKEELDRVRGELIERKSDLMYELSNLPKGELLCTDQIDGYRRYYQRFPAIGNHKKEHRYGVKKKPDVLNGLVRKEYVNGALKLIDCDIRVLERAISAYKPIDENSIMEDFVRKYPELSSGIYGGVASIEEWKTSIQRIDNFHPEDLKHILGAFRNDG